MIRETVRCDEGLRGTSRTSPPSAGSVGRLEMVFRDTYEDLGSSRLRTEDSRETFQWTQEGRDGGDGHRRLKPMALRYGHRILEGGTKSLTRRRDSNNNKGQVMRVVTLFLVS